MTIDTLVNRLKKKKDDLYISGLHGASFAYFYAKIFPLLNQNLIIIFDNMKQAELFYSDLIYFLKDQKIMLFPDLDILPFEKIYNKSIISQRIQYYSHVNSTKENYIFIFTLKSLLMRYVHHKTWQDSLISVKRNQKIDFSIIENQLLDLGFQRCHKVTQKGHYAIRGEIIDIFSPNYDDPVRIELFDTMIEDIRFFNIRSQKSITKSDQIVICPAEEIILKQENIDSACEKIDHLLKEIHSKKGDDLWEKVEYNVNFLNDLKEKIKNREYFNDIYNYFSLFYQKKESLLDIFNIDDLIFFPSLDSIVETYESILEETHELYKKRIQQHEFVPHPEEYFYSMKEFEQIVKKKNKVFYNILPFNIENEILFHVKGIPDFKGDKPRFLKHFKKRIDKIHFNFISEYDETLEKLEEVFQNEINKGLQISFQKGLISQGFEIDHFSEIFIQDFEFLGRIRKDFSRSYRAKIITQEIESIYDLQEGDFIVHIENGIGLYRGIERIKTDNKMKDFFVLEYANNMKLFLPLDKINLIHKYIGDDDNPPVLNKLGSKEFSRTKNKVEKSIITITKDLIKLYAIRKKATGYIYKEDTDWQKKFEMAFKYVETPDQIKALYEIKKDMQDNRPMDRLLCGDVGYGKTEVAIRAAFKAVMEGKQVALLVPTTILAQQHFNTFKQRLKEFPVRTEVLSRFISKKAQKHLIKEVNEGKIDIIIGTHRLLSQDVKFQDIGLIIIDEEQKFGVVHKERLKMIRHIVDVLTMSATPIPRTLYMSLSGIRDISLIETAPEGRMPIETKVEKFSIDEIRRAVLCELDRGGQVFFIHNRVNSIYAMQDFLKRHIPEARFLVAHGRMESEELELAMLEFVEGNYDVLVATTIIESGIDMPNVNTIIINRADAFGLSQLYQLRGRVGRGLHKGYALLLYPGNKALTEIAQKRLMTIYEYTDLGAGYNIALRDLEIRGAGNIFGPQQHGNIVAVGLEMYSKILKQAIKQLKGEEIEDDWEVDLDFNYNAFIPDTYISDNRVKIEIYKNLNKCIEFDDLQILIETLQDRFGREISIEMKNLFVIQRIKIICKKVGIFSVKRTEIKKYEYVFQLKFLEKDKNIKKKVEKIFKTYRIDRNSFYINIEKEDFLYKLEDRLLLLINDKQD